MESGEAWFLVRVTTAEKPPGWEAGILKRIRREIKYMTGGRGEVMMARRDSTDPAVVGNYFVTPDPQSVMCGPTGDDCFCACGCGGDDSRCDHWVARYAIGHEVDETHTCCKVKQQPTHQELVEMPAEELKRLGRGGSLASPVVVVSNPDGVNSNWDRWIKGGRRP